MIRDHESDVLIQARLANLEKIRALGLPLWPSSFDADTTVSRVLAEIDHLDEIARAFSRYGTAPEDRTPAVPVDVAAVVHDVIALERLGEDGEREAGVRWNIDAPEPGTEQVVALAQRDELKEVLLNVLARELQQAGKPVPDADDFFAAVRGVHRVGNFITTESVVMRASSGTVRWIRGEHRIA